MCGFHQSVLVGHCQLGTYIRNYTIIVITYNVIMMDFKRYYGAGFISYKKLESDITSQLIIKGLFHVIK